MWAVRDYGTRWMSRVSVVMRVFEFWSNILSTFVSVRSFYASVMFLIRFLGGGVWD